MKKNKMYDLSPIQMPFFEAFRNIGYENREILVGEIAEFIKRQHINSETGTIHPAVVGLSGGVDSSVMAALLALALGPENVIGVKMPYIGMSSKESIDDANDLAKLLGITKLYEMPINDAVDAFVQITEAATGVRINALGKGNIMARARMIILYDISGKNNGRVVDTCNLTEIMVGFFTKYGDGASDYNPVGNLYKTWIWELAKFLKVPENIINKIPSAELEPDQTDEGDMGITYRALDLLLYLRYEKNVGKPRLMREFFFSEDIIDMVVRKVGANEHKRMPPPVCEIKIK